jgi:hypothetical protein
MVLQEIVWKHFPNPDMPESKREEIKKTVTTQVTLVAKPPHRNQTLLLY